MITITISVSVTLVGSLAVTCGCMARFYRIVPRNPNPLATYPARGGPAVADGAQPPAIPQPAAAGHAAVTVLSMPTGVTGIRNENFIDPAASTPNIPLANMNSGVERPE